MSNRNEENPRSPAGPRMDDYNSGHPSVYDDRAAALESHRRNQGPRRFGLNPRILEGAFDREAAQGAFPESDASDAKDAPPAPSS